MIKGKSCGLVDMMYCNLLPMTACLYQEKKDGCTEYFSTAGSLTIIGERIIIVIKVTQQ